MTIFKYLDGIKSGSASRPLSIQGILSPLLQLALRARMVFEK
jgi:hypothetical protein